ncbi:MAG: amino acid permease [Bacteroidetes bacterium]|jgi:amino acid transporter/nucleotide-binding universal stress UspA family protein|nr:amino acid permease [Bacteroidota bacterium]
MADHRLQDIFRKKLVPVTFERTLGLFGATTIGVGALMGAGVYVLIGLAAGEAGPSVWISYIVCGGLAFLTTLLFAELARLVPMSGGGYAYAYRALGSLGGFVTGWFLALGSIFACGLYAIGFAEYFASILGYQLPGFGIKLIAGAIVLLSTFLNSRGTEGADRIQNVLTWGNLAVLIVLLVGAAFYLDPELAQPAFPNGLEGTFGAIGIIYISFFGYQLIANNADEIREPTKTVPQAMKLSMGIALLFYLLVAVASVLVIPWQQLSASSAPLVDVATAVFGGLGWVLISTGGVLASAGALNSTVLSQGRQIYAMGKDRFVPGLLGRVHEGAKTPRAAILAGGILILVFLLLFDLAFIAKSANFCLLISLLPVSLALRQMYRRNPAYRPKLFLKRILPEITLIVNLGLLFSLDWLSLLFGLQLALIGGLVFFFYSRKRVVRQQTGMHLALADEKRRFKLRSTERILMPVANPHTQRSTFAICNALLAKKGGEVVALHIVNTPEQMDFRTALSESEASLELLERMQDWEVDDKVVIRPVIRASHRLGMGIVHAAEEENCDLIVMGYTGKPTTTASATLMERVLNRAPVNCIFFKLKQQEADFQARRIAVSLGGHLNLNLMVRLAGAVASYYGGEITFLNILPEDYTPEQQAESGKVFIEAIQRHSARALYSVQVLASNDPIETLIEKSAAYDLLIVGTTKVGILQQMVLGKFATQITERAHCSVAVVRVLPIGRKLVTNV